RVTLKYCSLTESEFTEVDCHGGDDHGECVNGGAGTRYDRQECSDDESSGVVHTVHIDNQGIETRALTLFDDKATVPAGVTLNEFAGSNSTALGTRQATVSDEGSGTGLLEVSDGCVVVPVGYEVDGEWSTAAADTVTLSGKNVHVFGSAIIAAN